MPGGLLFDDVFYLVERLLLVIDDLCVIGACLFQFGGLLLLAAVVEDELHLRGGAVVVDEDAAVHVFPCGQALLELHDAFVAADILVAAALLGILLPAFVRDELRCGDCPVRLAHVVYMGQRVVVLYFRELRHAVADVPDDLDVLLREEFTPAGLEAGADDDHASEFVLGFEEPLVGVRLMREILADGVVHLQILKEETKDTGDYQGKGNDNPRMLEKRFQEFHLLL